MASPTNTLVIGTSGSITDTAGKVWTINASGQVAVNGTADTSTSSVTEIFWDGSTVWQESSAHLWWQSPNNTAGNWTPAAGTSTSPVPSGETITINTIGNQGNTVFTVTGSVSGVTSVPTLKYQLDNTTYAAFPAGSSVTLNPSGVGATFSLPVGPLAAGTHTVQVEDFGSGSGTTTTWNPSDKSATIALSNSNLTATATTSVSHAVRSTTSVPVGASGKRVWMEFTMSSLSADWAVGVANASYVLSAAGGLGADTNALGIYPDNAPQNQGAYVNNAQLTSASNGADINNATVTVGVDTTTTPPTLWFSTPKMRANGFTYNNSTTASPATLSGGIALTGLTGTALFAIFGDLEAGTCVANFGGSTFSQPVPGANGWQSWNAATGGGTALVSASSNAFTVTAHAASPNNTVVGTATSITDTNGIAWTINGSAQVAIGGTADTSAGAPTGVLELAWVSSTVWALNGSLQWQQNAALSAGHWTAGQAAAPFVNTAPPKGITVNTIVNQTNATAFTVSGGLQNYPAAPSTLQYMDSTNPGVWTNLPSPTVTATTYSFTHPALATGSNRQVSIRDSANQSVVAQSNLFNITAAATATITGITLSGTTVTANASAGTTVGTISVQESGGTFAGTLAVSGANASSFVISGTSLNTTAPLASGTYSINITATQSGVAGSPFLKAFTITSVAATAGVGVNLGAPTSNVVPPTLWGVASGALLDNSFTVTGDASFQASAATLDFQLIRFNVNSGANEGFWEDAIFGNGVNNPDWSFLDPWFTNSSHFWNPSHRLLVGLGPCAGNVGRSASDWAAMATQLASHFKSMGQEVFWWEVGNEPNQGAVDINTYNTAFIAIANALHNFNPAYKVGGPCATFDDGSYITPWAQTCGSVADFTDWHAYGTDLGTADAAMYANYAGGEIQQVPGQVAGTPMAGKPYAVLEYNLQGDSTVTEPRQSTYKNAVCTALRLTESFKQSPLFQMGAMWDATEDGNYGVIQGSTINPAGYYLGKAGQVMGGTQVPVTINISGNIKGLASISGNNFAIHLVNFDTGATYTPGINVTPPSGHTISGSLATWIIGSTHTTTPSTGTMSNGGSFTLPPASVAIITGTFA